jgi:hypothetical protein
MNDDFETVTAAIADAFTRQDAEGIVRYRNNTRRFTSGCVTGRGPRGPDRNA